MRPFGHEHYPFSYQLTSWFCMEVSTTCYFSHTLVPLRASRYAFFPIHLLHCYIHPFCKWTLPRGSEQACIDEPLLAQACRTTLLWVTRVTYSKEAMPPKFFVIVDIQLHTYRIWTCQQSPRSGFAMFHHISVAYAFMCMCISTKLLKISYCFATVSTV